MNEPKWYAVYIHDDESGLTEPMRCKVRSITQAREQAISYIHSWNLKGAYIDRIEVCDGKSI